MTNKNAENSGCCSPGSGCCSVQPEVAAEEAGKRVEIDFLYLDLSVCTRCREPIRVLIKRYLRFPRCLRPQAPR